ncbi:MAG: PilZ domain-containing protein [Acidobacteriota bacterium]
MEKEPKRSVELFHEKRRLKRVRIGLPVRVRGTNAGGVQFEEMSRSVDVSADGALFLLKQDLKRGTCVTLSLPLPRSMQRTLASKPAYETEAVVVRIEMTSDHNTYRVAVRFRSGTTKAYYREVS